MCHALQNPAVAAALLKRAKRLEKLKKAKDKPTAAQRLEAFQKKSGLPVSPPRSAGSTVAAPAAAPNAPNPALRPSNVKGKGRPLPAWFLGPAPKGESAFVDAAAPAAAPPQVQSFARPNSAEFELQSVHSDDGLSPHASSAAASGIPHVNLAFPSPSATASGSGSGRSSQHPPAAASAAAAVRPHAPAAKPRAAFAVPALYQPHI